MSARSIAVLILLLAAVALWGATERSGLPDPIAEFEMRRTRTNHAWEVNRQFLAGDWSQFEEWALLLAQGKLPESPPQETPHALFFLKLRKNPDRTAILKFFSKGRRLHSGLSDPYSKPDLPALLPPIRSALLGYFAAFDSPASAKEPLRPLGKRLVFASHQPDAAMVGLAGDLLLAEALSDLLRFEAAPRRFFRLETDYSTRFKPTDDLFEEAIVSLTKLGRERGESEKVRRALISELERLTTRVPDGQGGSKAGQETVILEVQGDRQSSGVRKDTVGQESPLSRVPRLRAAIDAILSPKTPGADLEVRTAYPSARWVRHLQLEGGFAEYRDGRLHYVSHRKVVGALDASSGNLFFAAFSPGFKNAQTFSFNDEGQILLPAKIPHRGTQILALDPMTGRILKALPIRSGPFGGRAIDQVGVSGRDLLLSAGARVWRQSQEGHVIWEKRIPSEAVVSIAHGKIAVMNGGTLELFGNQGTPDLKLRPADLVPPESGKAHGVLRYQVLLNADTIVFVARHNRIVAADMKGKLLWSHNLPGYWIRHPFLCGRHVCALTRDQLSLLPLGGGSAEHHRLEGVRHAAAFGNHVYLMNEKALVAVDRRTGRIRPLLSSRITRRDSIVAAVPGGVIINIRSADCSKCDGAPRVLMIPPAAN